MTVLNKKILAKEDISDYRPKGTWKRDIEKEAENIKKAELLWNSVLKKNVVIQ